MNDLCFPGVFRQLFAAECAKETDVLCTNDGFLMIYKSLCDILAEKNILDFPDSTGQILACNAFFDDWFLYAIPNGSEYIYSLLKLREQEHDGNGSTPADGDTPGITISFICFNSKILLDCLLDPTYDNRQALNREINRVVAYRGQSHHNTLKQYFIKPEAEAPYLVATLYTKHIASFSENSSLDVPDYYKEIVHDSVPCDKFTRIPRFIEYLNQQAGRTVCDHTKIYITDPKDPDLYERAAILATHTGNTSVYSFAAEVEFHARFLTSLAKIKLPFLGKSIYDSAIRADMTISDTELEGPAPFRRSNSRIVKRQYQHHKNDQLYLFSSH